jgi:hypothetical protein
MLRKGNLFLWVLLVPTFIGLYGCSNKSTLSSSKTEYGDDLSKVRPRYTYVEQPIERKTVPAKEPVSTTAKPAVDKPIYINKRLDAVLDTVAKQNKAIRYISGFRIQVYVGNVRQEADNAKSYIYQAFPGLNPYVSYAQPTYRVKAGDFMYRSDAEQYLEQIRDRYASAVILADRVEIKKSLMLNSSSDQN